MLNHKMTCLSSSDPAAVNATLLFDLDNDDENLWTRSSHGGPLPLCSSPSSPPDSLCWVCLEQKVYAVCHNLTDGVKIMMEAGGVSVDLLKSDCPKPPSDGDGDDDQKLRRVNNQSPSRTGPPEGDLLTSCFFNCKHEFLN
ncbi:uncharacterized protein LOC144463658 isoform X2 [Epinephelus lanceolatus]